MALISLVVFRPHSRIRCYGNGKSESRCFGLSSTYGRFSGRIWAEFGVCATICLVDTASRLNTEKVLCSRICGMWSRNRASPSICPQRPAYQGLMVRT